jgi:hypothetical protein
MWRCRQGPWRYLSLEVHCLALPPVSEGIVCMVKWIHATSGPPTLALAPHSSFSRPDLLFSAPSLTPTQIPLSRRDLDLSVESAPFASFEVISPTSNHFFWLKFVFVWHYMLILCKSWICRFLSIYYSNSYTMGYWQIYPCIATG